MTKLKLTVSNNTMEDTFKGKFYVLREGNMLNLIVADSHFSMASVPNEERLVKVCSDLLDRYKTYEGMRKALKNMEYPVKVAHATLEQRQKRSKNVDTKYTDLIEELIESRETAMKEAIKEKTKVKPIKVKKKVMIKKV